MKIIDSSVLISLFNPADINHTAAKELFKDLEKHSDVEIINNYILAEIITISKVKMKFLKKPVFEFSTDLLANKLPNYKYQVLKPLEVLNIFKESILLNDKLSIADYSLIYMKKFLFLQAEILTFDKEIISSQV